MPESIKTFYKSFPTFGSFSYCDHFGNINPPKEQDKHIALFLSPNTNRI